MPTPTWIQDLMMTKVDIVDRPADEHGTFKLFKSDSGLTPEGTVGHGQTDLAEELAMMGFSKTDLLPEHWEVTKSYKEGEMPELSEEILKGLPDEVLEYIGHLEKSFPPKADEADDEDDDTDEKDEKMEKSLDLPADVMEMLAKRDAEIDELRKSASDAQSIAKAERDLRVTREWQTKFDSLSALSFEDKDAVVKSLKDLADTNPALASATFSALQAANGQADSAALFAEIGKGAPVEGSAEARLEAVVKNYQTEKSLSEPDAWDLALREQPELYSEYLKEQN